jgi:hypothetical protein
VALAIGACGDGDSGQECVPGDASRLDVVCSSSGKWVKRQASLPGQSAMLQPASVAAPSPALCPSLPLGNYALREVLANGTSQCSQSGTREFAVGTDGRTSGLQTMFEPCVRTQTNNACALAGQENCDVPGCVLNSSYSIDGGTWTGTESTSILCSNDSAVWCTYDVWIERR